MATADDVDQKGIPKVEDSTPTPGAGRVCTDIIKHLGVFCWGTNQHVMALMDPLRGIYDPCESGSILHVCPDNESAWNRADGFSSVVIICPSQTFKGPEDPLRRFLGSCFTTHGPDNMMVVITDLEDTESEKRQIAEWKEGEYPRCPLLTLTEAEMDVISTSDTDDVYAERRMAKKVNRMREILQPCTGSSGNNLQRRETNKAIVGIFSREADSQYSWLVDLLQSDVFMDDIAEVRPCRISNNGWQQFYQDVCWCTFGILYHTRNRGRINVTDVNGSLYDEELEHLSSRLGKKKVIVVIDDLSDSSEQQKANILRNQPSIMNMAEDLFLISHEEKTSSYQRRLMVDREQLRSKLQMVIEKMRKNKNDYKKNIGGYLRRTMHQIASHIPSSPSGENNEKSQLYGEKSKDEKENFGVEFALPSSSKKKSIGIFSRSSLSEYSWLKTLLESQDFSDQVRSVHSFYVSNDISKFYQDVTRCAYGILYHSRNRGRINVTDVTDSLYDKELEYLYSILGKKNVVVVIDDLEATSDAMKGELLRTQGSIENLAEDLILVKDTSPEEKMRAMKDAFKKVLY
ncbi:uncharacterized protein [Eleutherodactylus coqui]|uniref:uncharacterized protein n=1 Tax=Eleutherodactylus coqui TaxID=57060 RepID=UPI00346236A8